MKKHQKNSYPFRGIDQKQEHKGISRCGGNAVYIDRISGYTDICIFLKITVLYISDLYISPYVNLAKKKKKLTTKFELKKKIGLNVTLTKECVSQVKNKSHYFQKKKIKYFTMMRCVYCQVNSGRTRCPPNFTPRRDLPKDGGEDQM